MCDDTVRVALRIRPLVENEIEKGCQMCLDAISGEQVRICNTDKAFTYNYVFPPHIGQEDFYNTAIKRLVDNIFQGYNVTILAYGQTGSGKTHSMGTNYTGVGEKGIIPRVIYDIFEIIKSKEDWSFKVAVSFMELYQEQLYDLLSDKQKSQSIVDIREDGKSIKIVGVTEKQVKDAQETLEFLAQGSIGRVTGATAMNAHSSRSHAIFTLCIRQQKRDDPNTATVAKFHLVDLAGSERSKKTQATGERFKEGVNINKGLLALGNVISQLGDGASGLTYIGYRDSKLTRLLQDSLGGNSMTLMVACVSPADYNLDETLSTLRYADRARKIKNKPIVNQDPKVAEINRLNKLVQELRMALMNQELGITCPKEHEALEEKYSVLQQKFRDMTEKLNSNLGEIVVMHERAEMAEQAREKIRFAMSLLLDEFKQIVQDFDSCPEIDDEKRNKLKAIYKRMLDIQSNERKASEELINHEISNSKHCITHTENLVECVRAEELNDVEDSLDYFDKKEEEHTLRQAERNNEVQIINKELALKESLVSELLKNITQQTAESHKNVVEMEQEIKLLHAEKEEHLQAVRTHDISSKLAEKRRKQVQELEKKIAELTRRCTEQNKIIKTKEKQDHRIKTLASEIQSLKETRVKLIRQMRTDANNFTKWKQSKEKEINKLRTQDRKRAYEMVRMKIEHNKQENVFKRKMEEAFAVNKRLKGALEMQKKAMQRQERKANSKEEIKTWIAQELEILMATVEADYSLEKLMQDRASLVHQLEQLKENSDPNEKELLTITEFIELRNMQIADLQQKILESDQETRASTRWNMIRTITDAKIAFETAFHIVTQDRKQQCYKYNELKEKCQNLEAQLEEYTKQETVNKISCPQDISDTSSSNTEKSLTKSIKTQVLTENLNENKKSSSKKRKAESKIEEIIDENAYLSHDDSSIMEDNVDKDPDWKKTPLYSRIQKLQNKSKLSIQRLTFNIDPNESLIKCACKTKCVTRICTCRKNNVTCNNCSCDSEQCQNRNKENLRTTLFSDVATSDEARYD